MFHKLTSEIFINRAKLEHGDIYNYDKVNYSNMNVKVTIVCKLHGEFIQIPSNHLAGKGCPHCADENRHLSRVTNTSQFVKKANKKHNNFYQYNNVNYIDNIAKVIITCPIHGNFLQSPNIHLTGSGCQICGLEKSKTGCIKSTQQFINDANKIHDYFYSYDKLLYINSFTEIQIICPLHGDFFQLACHHIAGNGCQKCAIEKTSKANTHTTQEFIQQAKKIHFNIYTYDNAQYVNNSTKIKIACRTHGDFEQTPQSHLNGAGCAQCCTRFTTSKGSLIWLTYLESILKIKIIKEYIIPDTRFFADGFHKETNTIYEFYGDYFHGNPNAKHVRSTDGFDTQKAFNRTKQRENKLQKLGYNLITIWESDFKAFILPNIPEYIKQKALELWNKYQNKIIDKEFG